MIKVKVEYSRSVTKRISTLSKAMRSMPRAIAITLAKEIKRRAKRGDLAGQRQPPYPFKELAVRKRGDQPAGRVLAKSRYLVSPRYPVKGSPDVGPSGAYMYDSSRDFHKAMGGSKGYDVSGGMWAGLSAVVSGTRSAQVKFRGRSEGQNPNFRKVGQRTRALKESPLATVGRGGKLTRGKKGELRELTRKGKQKAKGLRVSNALKAGTVLEQHGVVLLAVAERELEGIGDAVVQSTTRNLIDVHDAKIDWAKAANMSSVAHKILNEWQRSNR